MQAHCEQFIAAKYVWIEFQDEHKSFVKCVPESLHKATSSIFEHIIGPFQALYDYFNTLQDTIQVFVVSLSIDIRIRYRFNLSLKEFYKDTTLINQNPEAGMGICEC